MVKNKGGNLKDKRKGGMATLEVVVKKTTY
jgi:hypothetical protein